MSAASLDTLCPEIMQLITQRLPTPWLTDFQCCAQSVRDQIIEDRVTRLHIPMHELSLHTQHSRRRRLACMTNLTHLQLANRRRRDDDTSAAEANQERQHQRSQLLLLFGLTPTFVANVTSLCLSGLPIQTVLLAVRCLPTMCPGLLELSLKDALSPEDGTMQQQWVAVFDALRHVSSMQGLTLSDNDGKKDFTGLNVVQQLQRLDITMLDCSQADTPLPIGQLTALTQLVASLDSYGEHMLAQLARLTNLRAVTLLAAATTGASWEALLELTALTSLVLDEFIEPDSLEHADFWDMFLVGTAFRQLVDLRVPCSGVSFDTLLALPQLTRLECAKMGVQRLEWWLDDEVLPLLKWADVAAFSSEDDDFVPQAVHRLFPNLEHLSVEQFGSSLELDETEDRDGWLCGLWPSGPACVLPHLRDVGVHGSALDVRVVHAFADSLHSLTLSDPCAEAFAGLEVLGQRRQLTQLQLLELVDDSDDVVVRMLQLCPFIVSLTVAGRSPWRRRHVVTDFAMVAVSRAGALRNVSISGCSNGLTAAGVMALAMSPTIESICVEGCRQVTRADARRVLQLVQRSSLEITVVDHVVKYQT